MTAFPYTPEVREDWPETFKSPEFWKDWRRDLRSEAALRPRLIPKRINFTPRMLGGSWTSF